MVRVGQFSHARIVFDARYSPLVITTFFGRCDLEAAQWHTELMNQATVEAARRGQRVITISDATHSDRPTPEARKYWADNMSTASAVAKAATLATYVVFTSAVVRGALTAIGWLNPDVKKIETFASLSDAIQAANLRFKKERITVPHLDPKDYKLPQVDSSQAAGS
jgi:hypothetical protein